MKEKLYFIIYLDETYEGDYVTTEWKKGSEFLNSYDNAKKLYDKISEHHSCQICQTIYG